MKSLFVYVLATLVAMTDAAFGVATSAQSGDWDNPSTWTGDYPTNAAVVVIRTNHVVVLNVPYAAGQVIGNLTIGDKAGDNSTLTQNGSVLEMGVGTTMWIGKDGKSRGTYYLVDGTNIAKDVYCGYGGIAVVYQSGGYWTNSGARYVGGAAGCYAEYYMSGGASIFQDFNVPYGGTGIVYHTGGTIRCKVFNLGTANAYGEYRLSSNAVLTSTSSFQVYKGRGKLIISGGAYTNTSTLNPAFWIAGLAGSLGVIEISDGVLKQTGTTAMGMSLGDVAKGTGTVVQTGGEVGLKSHLQIGNAGVGVYTISGGTLSVSNLTAAVSAGSSGMFHIIGTGCSNINVSGTMDMEGSGTGTLRVSLDNGTVNGNTGVTLVAVGGNAALDGATLEVGVTNGFSGKVTNKYTLIRVPQAKSITTNGMGLVNLSSGAGYEFTSELGNDGTYNLLKLVCTKAPISGAGTVTMIR